jgi:hypothetical protein
MGRPRAAAAPQTPARKATELEEALRRAREFITDDGLQIAGDPTKAKRIVVSGSTRMPSVKRDIERLKREFAGYLEIDDRVAYVLDDERKGSRLMERITEINVGEFSWFRTSDGTRYFLGSVLEDGSTVEAITPRGVVVERDDKRTVFPLMDH